MKYASVFRFLVPFPLSCMDHRTPLKVNSSDLWKYLNCRFAVWHATSKTRAKSVQNVFNNSPVHGTPLPTKITMNQQHVINLYLTEAPASIRHCPTNLLNNVEWLSAEVMIFSVKSQQSILFSLLKIWPGPTKAFVAEAGSPILAVLQAGRAHADGDVFYLCLYIPARTHVSIASNRGPSIEI